MNNLSKRGLLFLAAAVTAGSAASPGVDTDDGVLHNFSFQSGINFNLSVNAVPHDFCDPNSRSISGYFGVDGSKYDNNKSKSKHYFYWMFEKRAKSLLPKKERLIIHNKKKKKQGGGEDEKVPFVVWLNGGPGCSSLLGLLQENGPCLVNKDGHSTTINPYAWTEVAHVLFLDQPAQTGYSYGDANDDDEEKVAEDAYYFLQSFFSSEEGSMYKDLPLYLTGESYAGHYIPAIANRIWKGNQNLGANLLHLPLSGVAIGNGFIDAEEHIKWYAEMAYNNPHGLELITESEYKQMKAAAVSCSKDAHSCNKDTNKLEKDFICQKASNCEENFFTPLLDKNISIYDITKPCIGDLCDDMTPIETFLNLAATKEALGVSSTVSWEACDDYINVVWSTVDRVTTFAPYISQLLEHDMPVLIYAGDLDYICNYMGNRAISLKLEWEHGDNFRSAKDTVWNHGGGLARSSNGLTFLQVYGAGHMVPQDQPKQALHMISQFLNGEEF